MAKLTKEQYEKRRENAAMRHEDNKIINTLTEEQHDIIAEVCDMRHEIHSRVDELYNSESQFSTEAYQWIDDINSRLLLVGLEEIANIPRIEDFPSADDRYLGLIEDDDEEENIENFNEMHNKLNNSIEDWLRRIDEQHKTNYCPTGFQRLM